MFAVNPSAVMRLVAPSDNTTAVPKPPLGTMIDELGVNSIRPPPVASTRAVPKPFGYMTVMPFAMIVPSLASMAIAPPPVFPNLIPLATIVPPLAALKPTPAALTLPFAVSRAFVVALMPVPPPLAVTVPLVVTLPPFESSTAVPKPVLMGLLLTQVPPLCRMPPLLGLTVHCCARAVGIAPRSAKLTGTIGNRRLGIDKLGIDKRCTPLRPTAPRRSNEKRLTSDAHGVPQMPLPSICSSRRTVDRA